MALQLQFFNVIIPLVKINQCKDIGGFSGLLKELEAAKKNIWYDKYLFRDGAMNMADVNKIIEYWEKQGLVPIIKKNSREYWNDLCVVDFFDGPTLPCEWLEFVPNTDQLRSYVFLKGKPAGDIIGSENLQKSRRYYSGS